MEVDLIMQNWGCGREVAEEVHRRQTDNDSKMAQFEKYLHERNKVRLWCYTRDLCVFACATESNMLY